MQYNIYWVNLDPTKGSEISKTRPCVVISPDEMNEHLKTLIVAPITSALKKYPSRFSIEINGIENEVALDQIRTISKQRIEKEVKQKAKLSNKEIEELKGILREMLL